ncbi:ankyrin repeat-containing domain protein [Trichoderma velutinum]
MAASYEQYRTWLQILGTRSYGFQRLHRWLSPPDTSENYNNGIKQRHGDSGQWFLQSKEYSLWKSRPNSFLWLQGIPGCGKTVLSSIIVKDLEDSNVNNVLYFFFDFANRDKRLFDNALCSLVLQLYYKNENTQTPLNSLYDFCKRGTIQPSTDELFATFQTMLQQAGEIHVILDALDECQPRKERPTGDLLTSMEALITGQHTNLHLLVTARPEQDIKLSIESWARNQEIVPIQSGRIAGDVAAYIRARVQSDESSLKRWNKRPEVQDEIEARLSKEANGMFRWVTCQLDTLENCLDYPALQEALNSLPMTLDETYARILTSLPHGYEHHARRLLQFLTFSERPLTIKEAVDAMAVDTTNSPPFDPKNRMPVPEEIVRYCSSLVVLTVKPAVNAQGNEEAIQELQLAHLSVKEYLLSDRVPQSFAKDFDEATARASIAQVCLAYLLQLEKIRPVKELRQSLWLAQYSAQYWMDHAVVAESGSEQVCALITKFFACQGARTNCYRLYCPDQPGGANTERMRCGNAASLYYASFGGSCFAVRLLLDKKGVNLLNFGNSSHFYHTALHAAIHNGHDKVVQILLARNARINAPSRSYFDALQAAAGQGHDNIVQILLENGAQVNARGGLYGTALQAASFHGRDKAVQVLLDNNADVNAQGGEFYTALQAASFKGHDRIVQMLLDKGADVDAQGGYCGNALQAALSNAHDKIAQMLRDRISSTGSKETD